MKNLFSILPILILSVNMGSTQNAEQLVADMVNAIGGKQAFYDLRNVTYDLHYNDPSTPVKIISKETYVFDGELSYGDFAEHGLLKGNGKVAEGFDGKKAWVKFNNSLSLDENANMVARFLRKTNYYWFAMFFKLQDQGVNLEYGGFKKVEGRDYDLVKVTFGNSVGDAQDTYIIYINRRTKLVDQFLFTIVAFGVTEPKLMKVKYDTINGIKIPYDRIYTDANWEGDVVGKEWVATFWSNIQFDTDVDNGIFLK